MGRSARFGGYCWIASQLPNKCNLFMLIFFSRKLEAPFTLGHTCSGNCVKLYCNKSQYVQSHQTRTCSRVRATKTHNCFVQIWPYLHILIINQLKAFYKKEWWFYFCLALVLLFTLTFIYTFSSSNHFPDILCAPSLFRFTDVSDRLLS